MAPFERRRTPWEQVKNIAWFALGACVLGSIFCVVKVNDLWRVNVLKKPKRGWSSRKDARLRKKKQRINYYYTSDANIYAQSTFGLDVLAPPLLRPRPPRERRLTLSLLPEASNSQRTSPQPESRLFSMLPAEIRLLIYEFALSGNTLHVEIWAENIEPKFHTIPCTHVNTPLSRTHQCWNEKWVSHPTEAQRAILDPGRHRLVLLPLLLTCRKIYSESIDILYRNTFDFRDRRVFLKLPRLLLPQRFNAIRSLQFDYYMGEEFYMLHGFPAGQWDWPFPLWEVIASMTGLRNLRVTFLVGQSHRAYWLRFQDDYMRPLRDAGIVAHVQLILPFASCPMPDMSSSNFEVIVPEEDGYAMIERLNRENRV